MHIYTNSTSTSPKYNYGVYVQISINISSPMYHIWVSSRCGMLMSLLEFQLLLDIIKQVDS